MSTLMNPRATASYDPTSDRIVLALRDGRDGQVAEFDPESVPAVINELMAARCSAKQARKATPLPPPMAPRLRPRRLAGRCR